jgi:predicted anti-sigma-YlaC factor YlaD
MDRGADPKLLACEEVCERLSDYLDRDLDACDLERVTEHLRACIGCERMARELAAVVQALHGLRCNERR